MNPWENPKIIKLRKELAYVCNIMIKIAKIPGDKKGYERYDYTSPEYMELALKRDKIGDELRIEWNKLYFNSLAEQPSSHQAKPHRHGRVVYTVQGGSAPVI